jgi:hypothetical protein
MVSSDMWSIWASARTSRRLVIAFVGILNPTASEVGVFVPLEQTVLSNTVAPVHRTSMFASYSLVASNDPRAPKAVISTTEFELAVRPN